MPKDGIANVFDDTDDDEVAELLSGFEATPVVDEAASPLSPKDQAVVAAADNVGQKMGYAKRSRPKKKSVMRRSGSYRTGRSEFVGLKTTPEVKSRLGDLTNAHDWVNGQLLAYALDALQEKIDNPDDPFWEIHQFHGVD